MYTRFPASPVANHDVDVLEYVDRMVQSVLTPPQLGLLLLPIVKFALGAFDHGLLSRSLPRLTKVAVFKVLLELGDVSTEEIEVDIELSRARIVDSGPGAKFIDELDVDVVARQQSKNLKLLFRSQAGPRSRFEQHVEDISLFETAVGVGSDEDCLVDLAAGRPADRCSLFFRRRKEIGEALRGFACSATRASAHGRCGESRLRGGF